MDFIVGQAIAYLKIGLLAAAIMAAVAVIVYVVQKRGAETDGEG